MKIALMIQKDKFLGGSTSI